MKEFCVTMCRFVGWVGLTVGFDGGPAVWIGAGQGLTGVHLRLVGWIFSKGREGGPPPGEGWGGAGWAGFGWMGFDGGWGARSADGEGERVVGQGASQSPSRSPTEAPSGVEQFSLGVLVVRCLPDCWGVCLTASELSRRICKKIVKDFDVETVETAQICWNWPDQEVKASENCGLD